MCPIERVKLILSCRLDCRADEMGLGRPCGYRFSGFQTPCRRELALLGRGIRKTLERVTGERAEVFFHQPPEQIFNDSPENYLTKVMARLKDSGGQETNIVVGKIRHGIYTSR